MTYLMYLSANLKKPVLIDTGVILKSGRISYNSKHIYDNCRVDILFKNKETRKTLYFSVLEGDLIDKWQVEYIEDFEIKQKISYTLKIK